MREWVAETAISAYRFLLPISWAALAIILVVLLPMAAWRKTRASAATGLLIGSYIFGVTTWFLGAAVTFISFGWFGLIVGLIFFGLGVVPLGIIGAYFKLDVAQLALSLFVMVVITLGCRFVAFYFASKADE